MTPLLELHDYRYFILCGFGENIAGQHDLLDHPATFSLLQALDHSHGLVGKVMETSLQMLQLHKKTHRLCIASLVLFGLLVDSQQHHFLSQSLEEDEIVAMKKILQDAVAVLVSSAYQNSKNMGKMTVVVKM